MARPSPAVLAWTAVLALSSCSPKPALKPPQDRPGAETAVPAAGLSLDALPDFPQGFPGAASLATRPRRGAGPVEWLWDESDLWNLPDGRSATFLRRLLRLWPGAGDADLPGLGFPPGSRLVDARRADWSASGEPRGRAQTLAGSQGVGGASYLRLEPSPGFEGGDMILLEALVENRSAPGKASLFAILPGEAPCHRWVVQAAFPPEAALQAGRSGLELSPRSESRKGLSFLSFVVKDPAWDPPEPRSLPSAETAPGLGFSQEKTWDQASTALAQALDRLSAPVSAVKDLARGRPGDPDALTQTALKVQESLKPRSRSPRPLSEMGKASDILASGAGDADQRNLVLGSALRSAGWDLTWLASRPLGEGSLVAGLPSSEAPSRLIMELSLQGETRYLDLASGVETLGVPPADLEGRLALRLEKGQGRLVTLPRATAETQSLSRIYDLYPGNPGQAELVLREKPAPEGVAAAERLRALAPGWHLLRWERSLRGELVLSARGSLDSSKTGLRIKAASFPLPEFPLDKVGPRRSPLALGPRLSLKTEIRIHVPDSARVRARPPESRISFRQGSYELAVEPAFKVMTLKRDLILEETQVPPDDVAALDSALDRIRDAEAGWLDVQLQ